VTTSVEACETTTRGAVTGPPDVVSPSTPRTAPRIEPLAEASLLERLRTSWSLAALVPYVDRDATRRSWRSAGVSAVALHVVALVAIVLVGRYALVTVGPTREEIEQTVRLFLADNFEQFRKWE